MANGIPTLMDKLAQVTNQVALVGSDVGIVLGLLSTPPWGIYQKGKPIIVPDSIISVNFKKEWRVSNYPQENGAFQSYNKVNTPYDVRIRMTKGGTVAERGAFLQLAQAIADSMQVYDITTPEATYQNANVHHYDYTRSGQSGAGLISVDFWLVEIRVTTAPQFSNTAAASAAGVYQNGTVQALPAGVPPGVQ